jgi:hypothetical protein
MTNSMQQNPRCKANSRSSCLFRTQSIINTKSSMCFWFNINYQSYNPTNNIVFKIHYFLLAVLTVCFLITVASMAFILFSMCINVYTPDYLNETLKIIKIGIITILLLPILLSVLPLLHYV